MTLSPVENNEVGGGMGWIKSVRKWNFKCDCQVRPYCQAVFKQDHEEGEEACHADILERSIPDSESVSAKLSSGNMFRIWGIQGIARKHSETRAEWARWWWEVEGEVTGNEGPDCMDH